MPQVPSGGKKGGGAKYEKPSPKKTPKKITKGGGSANLLAGARGALSQLFSGGGGQQPYTGEFRTGGGGGGGGYGGGGSSNYQAYLDQLKALREAAIQRTTAMRDEQLGDFANLRGRALPAIDRYAGDYNRAIGTAFDQNAQQSRGYQDQLAQLGRQVQGGLTAYGNPIMADLQAQGAGTGGLQGEMAANQAAASGLAGAQGTFNTRLAQVMDAARADFTGLGASTQQAGRGMVENEYMGGRSAIMQQYADALLKLQLMGVGG